MTVLSVVITYISCAHDQPVVTSISNPSTSGCCARLTTDGDQILMSWIHYVDDTTDALMFASMDRGHWSDPVEVRRGSNWFVNWADFPTISAYRDGNALSIHWLQMSGPGTFDYDVHIAHSSDGGRAWGADFVLHSDGVQAEHGFVSQTAVGEDQMFACWLDGRRTKTDEGHSGHDHGHGHGGEMMLRGAIFNSSNEVVHEWQLDDRVCDCCGTSSAMTNQGLVVAYRDRSSKEVRDIAIVFQDGYEWSKPYVPHPDGWNIAGCPVNGPALAARNGTVALAWYGQRDALGQVQVSFSQDAARSFGAAIRLDQGEPLGRVALLLLDDDRALVSWLEQIDEEALLMAAVVSQQGSIDELFEVARTSASRVAGFPVLSEFDAGAIIAWTDASSGEGGIITAQIEIP